MKNQFARKLFMPFAALSCAATLAITTPAHALPVGDLTGGGTFSDAVEIGDAWGSENGFGIDFWTIDVNADTELKLSIGNAAFDFGISVFEGIADTDFLGSFNNNGDYNFFFGDATFVAGTPDLFGPFNMLELLLSTAGTYSVAVGGVAGFGGTAYDLDVEFIDQQPVSAPATWLMALTGLVALARRQRKAR